MIRCSPGCALVRVTMAVDQAAADLIAAQVEASKLGEDRDQSVIRLSSAGSCPREIGYRITGAPGLPDPLAALVVFEIGHAIHQRVQAWLVDLGWARRDLLEVPLVLPAERARGTADVVSERLTKEGFPRPGGTRRAIEIKSIGNEPGEVFGKDLAGAFDRLTEPKGHHVDQATAYAWVWNTLLEAWHAKRGEFPFGDYWDRAVLVKQGEAFRPLVGMTWPEDRIDALTFVYVAKDGRNQAMPLKVFTQKVSSRRTARLVEKFRLIWAALDAGDLPPRLKDAFGRYSPCGWCPYRDLCIEGVLNDGGEDETEAGDEDSPFLPGDEEEAGAGAD
jgi:hypothetical protein